jgi:4-hydroxy-tetrahydrodipicolinate reductase
MGATVCDAVTEADDLELAARADPSLSVPLSEALDGADVVVDFTTPSAALENVRHCLAADVHAVVGTTGFDLGELQAAAEEAAAEGRGARVFVAPNFAIGAVLMMQMAREAAPHMSECEIVELHHERKLDAPSGTAMRTADLIREAGGNVHEPIHSVRLPGLVAHQEVIFGDEGQTLSIRHDSTDRHSFMPGVLLAVRKVSGLPQPFTVGLEHLL